MRKSAFAICSFILVATTNVFAATTKYTVTGKLKSASGYTVLFTQKDGTTKQVTVRPSGAFTFSKLTAKQLKGASLQLMDTDGRYAGPVVLAQKGRKVSTTFSGKALTEASVALGLINLKSGYAVLKKAPLAAVYEKPSVSADNGKPIGAGEMGLAQTSTSGLRIRAEESGESGSDADRDGIPAAFDADDDGDLVLDGSDPDSAGTDIPYTALFFDFRKTLNAHVRDGLTEERVNNVVAGENTFSLTFFYGVPNNLSVDGGHVICDEALTYCRPNDPLAFYGGVSESTSEFRNRAWSELLTDSGYPRMEKISLSGGSAIVASIQPRVNASVFRPGDVYRVVLTDGSREVASHALSLTPYFVSVPAIKEYNAGSGAVSVDYSAVTPTSGSIPGTSSSDPVVLSSDGTLTVTFWRPQRAALRSDESGYYDWGNLHYGLIVDEAQATCAGFYTNVSSDLSADSSPLGESDSPFASSGANLTPYTDTIGDRQANSSNTLSFTVNLKECLARAGKSPGTYSVTLSARGESLTGGYNAAAQLISVQIP